MILLVLFVFLFSSCTAEVENHTQLPEENSIDVSLGKAEISSAEQCEITINLIYHRDLIPLIPSIEELMEPIDLEGYEEKGVSLGDYYKRVITVTLENLLPGDYILNPIIVPLYRDGKITDELQSPHVFLEVNSNLLEEGNFFDDFEELPAKKTVPVSLLIIIVIILLAASVWAYIYFRKKDESPSLTGEIFRNRIEGLPRECENRVYYSSLTDLLREYMDRTIFLSVQSQTTEEFISQADSSTLLSDELKSRLFSFFKRSDEITFGGVERDIADRENDTRFCLDLINYIEEEIRKESSL